MSVDFIFNICVKQRKLIFNFQGKGKIKENRKAFKIFILNVFGKFNKLIKDK